MKTGVERAASMMLILFSAILNIKAALIANLHNFDGGDGAVSYSRLFLSSNSLYGTTANGGNGGYGTVFRIDTDGTGFGNLHNFTNWNDGATPAADLLLSGNSLYGTTKNGGRDSSVGTVFKINVDGTGFTNLFSFNSDPHRWHQLYQPLQFYNC